MIHRIALTIACSLWRWSGKGGAISPRDCVQFEESHAPRLCRQRNNEDAYTIHDNTCLHLQNKSWQLYCYYCMIAER